MNKKLKFLFLAILITIFAFKINLNGGFSLGKEEYQEAQRIFNPMNINQGNNRQQITLDVPIAFDEDNAQSWADLNNLLRSSRNTDFTLRVSGLGGDVFLVNDFNRAMEDSQKVGNTVNMDVTGIAASGHAYMTCGANKVSIRSGASLLFHQVYGISSLFFGYIQLREISSDSTVNNLTDGMMKVCLKNGRLSEKDIKTIKSGDDVVLLFINNQIIKQYQKDDMTFIRFTVPLFLTYLSNIIAVLALLVVVMHILRRAGK